MALLSWHPDGSKLVFSDQKPDRHHLNVIDALRPSETPTEESAEDYEPPEEGSSDDDTVEGEFREV